MIQFNLLPDVKLQYERAKRTQRLVALISIVVTAVAVTVAISLLVGVAWLQKSHMKDLDKEITQNSAKLASSKNLDQILTIQNQLESLTSLHDAKPAATRLYGYLSKVTPKNANLTSLLINFDTNTMEATGTANKFSTMNTFADTLKLTKYQVEDQDGATAQPAFSNVVLSSFGVDNKEGLIYTINFQYNPDIFDTTKKIKLIVPNTIPNRPSALFVDGPTSGANTTEQKAGE